MSGQPSNDNNERRYKKKEQGSLYDVFQKRLEKFNNEMTFNDESKKFLMESNEGKRSTVRQCLYEEFKKRFDKINSELSLDDEVVLNSSNLRNERSSIKNKLDDDPHTPIKEELNEASRKRLDRIGSELHLKEQCNQQRKGRSSVDENIFEDNDFGNLHSVPFLFKNQNAYEFTNRANNYKEFYDHESYGDINEPGLYKLKSNDINQQTNLSNLRRRQTNTSKRNVDSETLLSTLANEISSSYPSVLARSTEPNAGTANRVASMNLLSSIAQKLNTSPLELAKKVAKTELNNPESFKNDPQLSQILQKYISNTVQINTNQRKPKQISIVDTVLTQDSPLQTSNTLNLPLKRQSTAQLLLQPQAQSLSQPIFQAQKLSAALLEPKPQLQLQPSIQLTSQTHSLPTLYEPQATNQVSSQSPPSNNTECSVLQNSTESSILQNSTESSVLQKSNTCAAPSNISLILEKVLSNLERIQEEKNKTTADNIHPEGAPCTLRGTWSSYIVGLHFDIHAKNETQCDLTSSGPVELLIEVNDTSPPKHHEVINAEWVFSGTAMKLVGGPFYLISQNQTENVLATFAGYCRTCGSIDTIFGSWTFVFPSKDCQDVSVSIETKRDILRRSDLEEKRDERLKEMVNKQTCLKKRIFK